MTPRRVLITGGAGFLGTHLTRRLAAEGIPVRLLDRRLGTADATAVEFVRGDVRDPRVVSDAVRGVDTVIHAAFAAPSEPRDVIEAVNIAGTRNVCREAIGHGVRRLILVSSTIVTRRARRHPFLARSPLTRFDLYRCSRVAAETIVNQCGADGLSTAIARPKTFVGPGRVGAFAIVFEWVRRGRPVIVLGRGHNRYQLLDPRDMADGLARLAASAAEGLFYFGAQDVQTVRADLQALLDHAGTGARLRFVPAAVAQAALRGMELANIVPASEWHYMTAYGIDSIVDCSRATRELDWHPAQSNARALTEAYDWYVSELRASGSAALTRPVPLVHQALKRLNWLLPR